MLGPEDFTMRPSTVRFDHRLIPQCPGTVFRLEIVESAHPCGLKTRFQTLPYFDENVGKGRGVESDVVGLGVWLRSKCL